MKSFLVALCLVALVGCSRSSVVDVTLNASGQSSRVQYVVVHYTSASLERSLHLLTQTEVSSQYLIGDQPEPLIYRLVDEDRRAWHAGDSNWQGRTWLNASTIGIEIVHPGYVEQDGQRRWIAYAPKQIERLVELLVDIQKRHQLPIDAVIAHSDVAPLRKVDPGPLFPWQALAQAGLISWPNHAQLTQAAEQLGAQVPDHAWFQSRLKTLGYGLEVNGVWDELSAACLRAWQMKYRPSRYDGLPDLESAVWLLALTGGR